MICKNCGHEMRLDDTDYNFKGNKDNYYICEHCYTVCMEKIRYGKQCKVEWEVSDNVDNQSDT